MRHLFGMNATQEQGKAALLFVEIHDICNMKEVIETMPRIELALIIIGVFVLILCIIFGYAMIHEYRMYLENHWRLAIAFVTSSRENAFISFCCWHPYLSF